MRTFDLSPLYRSAIGFDRLAQLFDESLRAESAPSYPPYNIELVTEDKYLITMAVAGFTSAEIEIETERDTLKITGRKQKDESQRTFLHRGARFRASLPARRPCEGRRRPARQRPAQHRTGARDSGSAQAAQDPNRRRRQGATDRTRSGLIPVPRTGKRRQAPCAAGVFARPPDRRGLHGRAACLPSCRSPSPAHKLLKRGAQQKQSVLSLPN